MKKKIVFLVSGNGGTLQVVQNACKYGFLKAEVSAVIFDKQCKAINRARNENIPYVVYNRKKIPNKEFQELLYQELQQYNPDIICLTFDSILSNKIVKVFKNQIINLHPALLPAFPGLNSVQKSIEYGVKYTGATIHFINEMADSGPIICQYISPIKINESMKDLAKRMFPYEALMMLQVVEWLISSRINLRGRLAIVRRATYFSYPFCPAFDKFDQKRIEKIRNKLFENISIHIANSEY